VILKDKLAKNMDNYLNINDEREVRIKKLLDLQNLNLEVYPAKAEKKEPISSIFKKQVDESAHIAGRLITKREMGKLTFCNVKDESGQIQIAIKQDEIGAEKYKLFLKKIDIGDIVEVSGKKFITHKGEESVFVNAFRLLSKSILPLPDKFHGLQNEEIRLRKRYLDFISDPDLMDLFRKKTKFWHSTRNFLIKQGFFEVETPVLEATPGGADAKPFVTHHNALDIDVFLRISMGELWQKRLMVAGFEKTFEIGRQFRNEGMSREHLQDYTQMEFYWAYANYEDGMKLVEKLIKYVIKNSFGTLKFKIGDFENIDLSKKWKQIDYVSTVLEKTGINVLKASEQEIKSKLRELKVEYQKYETKGRLIDSLWKFCRKQVAGPVFLINHPVLVSPLAKRKKENSELTERFQIIIAGSEVGNGYSELNDPIDQAERFEAQTKMRESGDEEAQMHDKDFVEALEHGMPPTCGFGFSERLFAFFANKPVRECVMFPLLKPEK
jgi:lysyl-tRNA synthetase class 2